MTHSATQIDQIPHNSIIIQFLEGHCVGRSQQSGEALDDELLVTIEMLMEAYRSLVLKILNPGSMSCHGVLRW